MSSAAPEAPRAPLESIHSARRASALLNPMRLRLLRLAQEPASATELARRLSLPRQRVNYHVRELARAGFLRPAGRRRRRNWIEQRYVATARSYVLSPEILGALAPDWRTIEDTASADYLLALSEQVRLDVSRAEQEARGRGQRVGTLSFKSQFRFDSSEQRAEFANALRQAVVEVIARHTSPDRSASGSIRPGRGRSYRLVLGCYPVPHRQETPGAEPEAEGE
ncbi:MAG TPA: helix-turn-helix domain-containing protein [Thermoanaerobaculia bacterium]|jgi:DNA-binding transcriptional ArsR family regulator